MIFHLSIPAHDPKAVAAALASLLGGRRFDFHAFRRAQIVLVGDEHGTAVEVYPHTSELVPGPEMVSARPSRRETAHSASHFAIETQLAEAKIHAICDDLGWLSRRCDRGPFELIEVWIENEFLVELLPPDLAARYRQAMTFENWETWQ